MIFIRLTALAMVSTHSKVHQCHIWTSQYIIFQILHYQLTVVVCDVFLARVGESLLSSEGSDPGLTPRRYYFSVLALWPKSCQHIFYPFAHTVYFPSLPLSCWSSCLTVCVHKHDIDPIQGVDGSLQPLQLQENDMYYLLKLNLHASYHFTCWGSFFFYGQLQCNNTG